MGRMLKSTAGTEHLLLLYAQNVFLGGVGLCLHCEEFKLLQSLKERD